MTHSRDSNHYKAEIELRRGPWTLEEDTLLMHYIALHGDGRWNLLARSSGLKRTGKSCRLRWLNYLKPDVKRGNLSSEEQFLILELHSKWGNRWSRIAQHLPGRTDNEIKNFWRTRVQKQARQLRMNANELKFREEVRCYWMPRLLEKMSLPSLSIPDSAKPETTHKTTLTQAPPSAAAEAFEDFNPCVQRPTLNSTEVAQLQSELGELEIDPFLKGAYDELDLTAALMLASPTEIAYFDGSNYVDYDGFSDVLWN